MTPRLPTYFISHGGGPWPYMPERRAMFAQLERSLVETRRELGEAPTAILVVSGHWETEEFCVSSGRRPGMVYDYYGFPEYTYSLSYPAPGSPELAARVQALLRAGGVACDADDERGYDHGTFSLMQPIYPDADMPIIQLSIRQSYDPKAHLEAGRLLEPLRKEGVVIIGSGSSYHNQRDRGGPTAQQASKTFDDWLQQALTRETPAQRIDDLANWDKAPAGRYSHPQEDHLIPLMVAVGAAGEDAGVCTFHQEDFFHGLAISSFRFGEAPAMAPVDA